MKTGLLAWLASPCCGKDLKLGALAKMPRGDGDDFESGTLICTDCKKEFPVIDGVPRLTLSAATREVAKTRDSFAFEWQRYPGSREMDERVFLEESQLPAGAFKDKLVLDAGCGMGRYSVVALGLGAEIVAFDLSESLARVAAVAPKYPKLHVVQGDLLRPPFKKGVFDLVYSHGVLHHTADAKAAFTEVARLVKRGGYLSVWLYGKAGKFAEFATNPLREGRAWIKEHRRLAWGIVGARHCVSDAVRFVTTRWPNRLVYALCWPMAVLGAVPGLKYLTFSVDPDFKARVIENFDWIAPPHQSHHTKEELAGWYKEAGFSVEKILPHGLVPKPGILGRKSG